MGRASASKPTPRKARVVQGVGEEARDRVDVEGDAAPGGGTRRAPRPLWLVVTTLLVALTAVVVWAAMVPRGEETAKDPAPVLSDHDSGIEILLRQRH